MSNNTIIVERVQISKNRIDYFLDVQGDAKRYFNQKENMFVEYSEDIHEVPEGIAVIPLLTNLLPIAWFSDSKIVLKELDKTFYECIGEIKQGYANMYSTAVLKGSVNVNQIIDYGYEPEDKTASFFSGGVDSLATLITNIQQNPTLVTIWGADIDFNNVKAWLKVRNEVISFGEQRGLNNLIIKSSFRRFINNRQLNKGFYKVIKDNWWFGVQHGIGIIGHIAPYAYLHRLKTLYMPASLSVINKNCNCGSHPTVDNKVRIGGCRVVHEGFENPRLAKFKIIRDYAKAAGEGFKIRCCWESVTGENCCSCEKCGRTIMALLLHGMNPNNYGFRVDKKTIQSIGKRWKYLWCVSNCQAKAWSFMQDKFKEDKGRWTIRPEFEWMLSMDFVKQNEKNKSIIKRFIRKLYSLQRVYRNSVVGG